MIPSPEQAVQAARNHHRPPVTCGSRIRQALEHARRSKEKPAFVGRASQIIVADDIARATT